MKIILASKSPRRRDLIKSIVKNIDFTDNEVDETIEEEKFTKASDIAKEIARKKAIGNKAFVDKDAAIIGSDTIVVYDNEIFGKPKDREDAFRMLKTLSGNTHSVITGIDILLPNGKEDNFFVESLVTFSPLTDEMINNYIDTGDPFDKAGGYGIQNLPEGYIESISGDYNNIVGLPTEELESHLKDLELI